MKNYYVRADLGEEVPSYDFIVKAKTQEEAEKLAEKELKESYAEQWSYGVGGIDFSCYEITAEELLARLTIN
jgi:hypothetical protein